MDHSTLLYLVSKQELIGKLGRWTLLLQEFEFDILHRLGIQHTIADYLSRLESGEEGTRVKDNFPDGPLSRVTTIPVEEMNDDTADAWITEMTNFLATGLPHEHMSLDERKRLAVRNWNICLLNDTLYHKGVDGIWRRVVRHFEKEGILRETHYRIVRGHYAGVATTKKIWSSGVWWPAITKYAVEYG